MKAARWASFIIGAAIVGGCSAATLPPAPVAAVSALAPAETLKNDDWNIFPDPTTGNVEIYHGGQYVGGITGNEPEDPPMPHRVDE